MKGYDYDGVITRGIVPAEGDVIITGRSSSKEDVKRTYLDMQARKLTFLSAGFHIPAFAVYFMPTAWKGLPGNEGLINTGRWKALMIDALELEEFFEDNPTQLQAILDHLKGTTKITKV
jgi:hypothetical protein